MSSGVDGLAAIGTVEVKPTGRRRWARRDGHDPWFIGVAVAGAVVRGWGLGAQSLWYDEWLTTEAVSGSPVDVIRHVATREGIGPAYPLLMWVWVRVVGDGEEALRAVSAGFGFATVLLAYLTVRAFGLCRPVARVAALVVALHPMLVWYSQEARPYSLLALLGTLTLFALARALERGDSRSLLVWGSASAAAISVHYFAAFLVICEALVLLVSVRDRWRSALWGGSPIAVALVLLAPLAAEQSTHDANSRWISGFSRSYRLADAGQGALVGPTTPVGWLWMPVAALAAVGVVALWRFGGKGERRAGIVAGGVGIGAVVVAVAVTLVGADVLLGRYLIASMVPLIIAVAIGLALTVSGDRPWPVRVGGTAGVAVFCCASSLVVTSVGSDPDLHKPDWRAVAHTFEAGEGARIVVVQPYGLMASPLRHYVEDARLVGGPQSVEAEEIYIVVGRSGDRPCSFLVGRACSLVFLGARLPDSLAGDFELVGTVTHDQLVVERYRSSRPVAVSTDRFAGPGKAADTLVLALDSGG